jgi:hypothetical protein
MCCAKAFSILDNNVVTNMQNPPVSDTGSKLESCPALAGVGWPYAIISLLMLLLRPVEANDRGITLLDTRDFQISCVLQSCIFICDAKERAWS